MISSRRDLNFKLLIFTISFMFLFTFFNISNVFAKKSDKTVITYSSLSEDPNLIKVSLIQLIATPDKYDGKTVEVIGVGTLGFEDNYLFIHHDDCEYFLNDNALVISLNKNKLDYKEAAKLNGKYVRIVGVFKNSLYGYTGTISNIDLYEDYEGKFTVTNK